MPIVPEAGGHHAAADAGRPRNRRGRTRDPVPGASCGKMTRGQQEHDGRHREQNTTDCFSRGTNASSYPLRPGDYARQGAGRLMRVFFFGPWVSAAGGTSSSLLCERARYSLQGGAGHGEARATSPRRRSARSADPRPWGVGRHFVVRAGNLFSRRTVAVAVFFLVAGHRAVGREARWHDSGRRDHRDLVGQALGLAQVVCVSAGSWCRWPLPGSRRPQKPRRGLQGSNPGWVARRGTAVFRQATMRAPRRGRRI